MMILEVVYFYDLLYMNGKVGFDDLTEVYVKSIYDESLDICLPKSPKVVLTQTCIGWYLNKTNICAVRHKQLPSC